MKKRFNKSEVAIWSWEFTKIVITSISIVWVLSTIFSAIMVAYAIYTTGQFSFLDTFITENSTTFRDVVGVNLIKSCVENVFKYNDIFVKKKCYNEDVETTTENIESSDEVAG